MVFVSDINKSGFYALQELNGGGDIAQQMQISHDALVKKVSVSEANPGYTAAQDGLPMNFEQKRRLSIAIGQLPGDRVSEVLRIINDNMAEVSKLP